VGVQAIEIEGEVIWLRGDLQKPGNFVTLLLKPQTRSGTGARKKAKKGLRNAFGSVILGDGDKSSLEAGKRAAGSEAAPEASRLKLF
jgi:hypothetical protein